MAESGSRLERARAFARRAQLYIGLGMGGAVAGGVVVGTLMGGVGGALAAAPPWLALGVGLVVWRLWILAALPALVYLAARVVTLPPWRAALWTCALGEWVWLSLDAVMGARLGLPAHLVRVLTFVAGVALTRLAILRGTAAAERRRTRHAQRAAIHAEEYASLMRESERVAMRHAAGEAPGQAEGVPPEPRGPAVAGD